MNIASAEVQLLQDINALWIRGQKRDNPSLLELPPWELSLTLLRQQISASIVDDSRLLGTSIPSPASFNKGEEASPLPPNVGEVLIRGCVRRAWSCVVGNGRSRSVGTGLNELHSLQGNIMSTLCTCTVYVCIIVVILVLALGYIVSCS